VIPADGFFEWRGDAKARQPIWFRPAAGGIVYLAGLFDEGPETPFVVLTTQPAPEVAEVHDRMPVLLDRDRAKAWLARPDRALLEPPPPGWLKKTEVSTRVNDARNDDEACIAGATGQLRLI
jgi:putative SOS response-associated peptidase YedK